MDSLGTALEWAVSDCVFPGGFGVTLDAAAEVDTGIAGSGLDMDRRLRMDPSEVDLKLISGLATVVLVVEWAAVVVVWVLLGGRTEERVEGMSL
jgi:hypothetical protein